MKRLKDALLTLWLPLRHPIFLLQFIFFPRRYPEAGDCPWCLRGLALKLFLNLYLAGILLLQVVLWITSVIGTTPVKWILLKYAAGGVLLGYGFAYTLRKHGCCPKHPNG